MGPAQRSSNGWRSLDLSLIPGFFMCVWDNLAPILAVNAFTRCRSHFPAILHWPWNLFPRERSFLTPRRFSSLCPAVLLSFSPHFTHMYVGSSGSGSLPHAPYLFSHNYCSFIYFSLSSQKISWVYFLILCFSSPLSHLGLEILFYPQEFSAGLCFINVMPLRYQSSIVRFLFIYFTLLLL